MSSLKPETMVTRMKTRRNLENAMNTIRNRLKPPATEKKGSRKKNKPRSIPKKVLKSKIERYIPHETGDAEYFPKKLKRNIQAKKIVLKPKHKLNVVIATNKRKRRTPCKGYNNQSINTSALHNPVGTESQFKLVTSYNSCLTMEDIQIMDEDKLSDEDLMEILTCPSPVWWENIPERDCSPIEEPVPCENPTKKLSDNQENTLEIVELVKMRLNNKITGENVKKMAKLENILGYIKNRVINRSGNNEDLVNDVSNPIKRNRIDLSPKPYDDFKRRSISSPGSDISLNDDDLVRSLQSIDIPMQRTEHNRESSVKAMDFDKVVPDIDDDDKTFTEKNVKSVKDLNRLHPEDDILDMKCIKTPTDNDVAVWSSVSDVKRHDFDIDAIEVIDVEDELQLNKIKSPIKVKNLVNRKADETIIIDDDSNDAMEEKREVAKLSDDNKICKYVDFDETIYLDVNIEVAKKAPQESKDNVNERGKITNEEVNSEKMHKRYKPAIEVTIEPKIENETVKDNSIDDLGEIVSHKTFDRSPKIKESVKEVNYKTTDLNKDTIKVTLGKYIEIDIMELNRTEPLASLKSVASFESDDIKIPKVEVSIVKTVKTNDDIKESNLGKSNDNQYNNDLLNIGDTSKIEDSNFPEDTEKIQCTELRRDCEDTPDVDGIQVKKPLNFTYSKNINALLDSPKSINSLSTEHTECTEGTISDTNVLFIDESDSKSEDSTSLDEEYLEESEESDKVMEEEYLDEESRTADSMSQDGTKTDELVTIYKIVDNDKVDENKKMDLDSTGDVKDSDETNSDTSNDIEIIKGVDEEEMTFKGFPHLWQD